jgi:hypothetical protein
MIYAGKTKVAPEKTKMEIERLVTRYGAKGFVAGWQGQNARVEFLCRDRHIRFTVLIPTSEQATRTRWRMLLLLVKAKLAAVDANVVTFEQAFATDIVMPATGKTVWETIREPIKLAYESRDEPVALLGGPNG